MNKLSKLFNLLESENIDFFFSNLKLFDKLGIYTNINGIPVISIDYTIKYDKIKLLEILAEEMGHHFTTVGDYSNPNTYQDILMANKCENKALRWATEYLLPESEICNLISKNIDVYEMAAAAEVSVEFFMKRLEFLSLEKNTLNINGDILVLDNLPMFYLYKD